MGVRLVTEVLDHAGADWNAAERLVAVAVAEQVNDGTRRGSPDVRLIAHRAGMNVESLSKTLRRLAAKGTELRVATGTDKSGRLVFAHRGHRTDFAIPRLCPEDEHRTNVCMKRPDSGPALLERRKRADAAPQDAQCPDSGPTIEDESPDQSPANDEESTDGGPAKKAERPDGGPERPDGGPALPLMDPQRTSPQADVAPVNDGHASTPGWSAADKKTESPAVVAPNPPKAGRQAGLFSVKGQKLTEAQQIIFDWGRWNGYASVTHDDARAIHALVRSAYPDRATVPYLRAIAKPDGGGFVAFFEQLRRDRAEQTEAAIRALEATHPECEHGTPAGDQPHPVHGTPLCPMCRRGAPATVTKAGTNPDVVAAVTAYRDLYDGPLSATQVVVLTQQATALRSGGAGLAELLELARRAAPRGESLFVAATRKDA